MKLKHKGKITVQDHELFYSEEGFFFLLPPYDEPILLEHCMGSSEDLLDYCTLMAETKPSLLKAFTRMRVRCIGTRGLLRMLKELLDVA